VEAVAAVLAVDVPRAAAAVVVVPAAVEAEAAVAAALARVGDADVRRSEIGDRISCVGLGSTQALTSSADPV